MKMLIMALLTIFLVSCKGVNTRIVCKQIESAKIDALIVSQVSFKFNRCYKRCFSISDYQTVPDSQCGENFKSGNYPLETCDEVMGFHTNAWATELRPKLKKLNNLKSNLCDVSKSE